MEDQEQFAGFEEPKENYCKVPHAFFALYPTFNSMAEMKVVGYILRHTWGYQDYEDGKRITLDEFMDGRKRRDKTRIDEGTGLSKSAVISGLEKAIEHGMIEVDVDDSDKARVKKYYRLRMKQGYESHTPSVGKSYSKSSDSIPRTKKETKAKKPKKETSIAATPRPPAVLVYADIALLNPKKLLYEDIANAIGESPEDLEKWAAHIKDWISRGFRPTNIAGLLETYAKGGIALRTTGQVGNARPQPRQLTKADYEESARIEAERVADWESYQRSKRAPSEPVTHHVFANGMSAPRVWLEARNTMQGSMPRETFDTWLGAAYYLDYRDGVMTIGVQSEVAKAWLEGRISEKRVKPALELWAGEAIDVCYIVKPAIAE